MPKKIQKKWDLNLYKGLQNTRSAILTLGGEVVSLTGYGARAQARPAWESDVIIFALSTDDDSIVIDGPAGRITWHFPENLEPQKGVWLSDLILPSGAKRRLFDGALNVLSSYYLPP